jgi:hypothetical protein
MIAFSNVVAFSAFPRPRPLAPDFADVSLCHRHHGRRRTLPKNGH